MLPVERSSLSAARRSISCRLAADQGGRIAGSKERERKRRRLSGSNRWTGLPAPPPLHPHRSRGQPREAPVYRPTDRYNVTVTSQSRKAEPAVTAGQPVP